MSTITELEMENSRNYLQQICVDHLLHSILYDKPIILKNSDLMTIYTFIYNKCINDKNHLYCNFFYDYYKQILYSFLDQLKKQFISNTSNTLNTSIIQIIIQNYDKYKFLIKNLCIMFRILNKHYLLKQNYPNLYDIAISIWNENYMKMQLESILNFINVDYLNLKNEILDEFMYQFFSICSIIHFPYQHIIIETYLKSIESFYINYFDIISYSISDYIALYNKIIRTESHIIRENPYPQKDEIIHQLLLNSLHQTNYKHQLSEILKDFILDLTMVNINYFSLVNQIFQLDGQTVLSLLETLIQTEIKTKQDIFPFYYQIIIKISKINNNTIYIQLCQKIFNQYLTNPYHPLPHHHNYNNPCSNYHNNNNDQYNQLMNHLYEDSNYFSLIDHIYDQETFIEKIIQIFYTKYRDYSKIDQEISFWTNLKSKINTNIVHKINSLLNDLKQSLIFNQQENTIDQVWIFSKWIDQDPHLISIQLPVKFKNFTETTIKRFKSIHKYRTIEFNYYRSIINGILYFQNKSYTFQMSWIQAILLYVLIDQSNHNKSQWTGNQLSSILQIEWEIIAPILHSFTISNQNILQKSGVSNYIDKEKDIFSWNYSFQSPRRWTFKMPKSQKKNNNQSYISSKEYKYIIQSKIMKYLKCTKKATLNDIQSFLFSNNSLILQENIDYLVEIEYLIEMEYIEYDGTFYHYL